MVCSKAMFWLFVPLWMLLSVYGVKKVDGATDTFYTAAVFEHARIDHEDDSAADIIRTNLKYYVRAAEVAKSKKVDIIVFPEYGIFPYREREKLTEFLEYIPDPRKNHIPCDDPKMYADRPILYTLSCMAKNNSIFVVANTGDIQMCQAQKCPPDGRFMYNTNVVFDRNGKLVLKYYKEHLYFEHAMDLPSKVQDSTFETDFGIFSTYICFDVVFQRMADVAKWPNVTGVAFSALWFDQPPQWNSVQLWQSWAMANNSTMLAANTQLLSFHARGSGIFDGISGFKAYSYNPDGNSKLVVAQVPNKGHRLADPYSSVTAITLDKEWLVEDDGKDVKPECFKVHLDESNRNYHCWQEKTQNYTFVQLEQPAGYIEACHNGMCCSLDYRARNMTLNYYLGVYNGSQNFENHYYWCEENCVLTTCESMNGKPCEIFPKVSDTVFTYLHLRGNFTTNNVQPSIAESNMRLLPRHEWDYDVNGTTPYQGFVSFYNPKGRRIIEAGLKGRCFSKDPPYVR